MFVALVLGMVSCQNYLDDFDVNVGGEKEVVVSVSLPESTRANSAVGAISNEVIESDEYTLRYIFQIWDEAKQQKKDAVVEYSDDTTISFPVRLVPGRNYRFVVWADVVREGKKEDLHYNTANFPTISVNTDSWVAMDETRDAYTTSELITDFGSAQNYTLTLKRPFAKLRVITTDMDELMGVVPTTATVTYTTEYYNTFNALDSKAVRESKNENKEHKDYTIKEYELTNGKVLFTDYFFAENDAVSFNLSVNMSDNGEPITRNFNTDIPVNRNHLTTLIGNILTEGDNIEVRIEEGFDGEIEYPIIDRTEPANNEIWYTSTDGSVVNPRSNTDFGANIISNTYYGGRGIISFDGDVTKIGDYAFSHSYPSSFKSVILPKTVTEIGQSAFQFNYALEDINLPEGITSIGEAAFFDCNSLTSITIPDSVVSIGDLVFAGTNINSFSGKGACDNGKCLVFGDELYAFATGCDATNYTIPAGVKTIKWGAFAYSTIESIDFKNTDVTTIEQYAFAYCDNLRSVTIPMGITSIGESAFRGFDNLKEVYFQSNTPIVGTPYMFGDPTKVTIYVPGPVVDSYKNAEGWEEYKDVIVGYQPNNQIWYTSTTDNVINPSYTNGYVANIISNTYENGIGVIVFDDDIYAIGYNTFFNNNQLLSITIPNSVTTIEHSAFQMCNNLQEVIIPNSVTKILNGAFSTCSSLTHIELPQNLSTIGTYVFQAAGITEITIPSSVTYIGECALDCNVKNIYCKSTTPPEMGGELCQHLRHNGCSKKIYVPTESVDAYKSAEGWSSYADAIEGYSF